MESKIIVNNTSLDLGDAKVDFKRSNPMFETTGSYSLPFQIPRTKKNENVLQLKHVAVHERTISWECTIMIGPVPMYGKLVIKNGPKDYYECYFTTGDSTFRSQIKGVKLTDIDYTEEITGSGTVSFCAELELAARSSYPTYNYTCFPLRADEFFEDDPAYNIFINPWGFDSTTPANTGFDADGDLQAQVPFAPSFYLCFVLQKIFDEYGYAIHTNEIYADAEMRTLVVVNVNTKGYFDTYRQYDLRFEDALPDITIADFISDIEKIFNLTFFIDDLSRSVLIKKNTPIILSTPVKTLSLVNRNAEFTEVDGYRLHYNNDPDDAYSEIKSIDGYELGLAVANKSDLTHNAASSYKNQLCEVYNEYCYYLSKLTDPVADTWEWELFTKDFFDYKEDGEQFEITSNANPLAMDSYVLESFDAGGQEYALFPRTKFQVYSSNGYKLYRTFSTLRLLFYRGIIDSGGKTGDPETVNAEYPLASSDVYRPKANISPESYGDTKITGADMSLRWGGTYGLFQTHYKDFIYWWINLRKPAIDTYHLTPQEIFSLNFWEKYRAGDVSVLIRNMEIEIDFANDTVTAGRCEVYIS
jgi:hypothetical protein